MGDSEPEEEISLEKTTARDSARDTLLPTCAEFRALRGIDELRLQSQPTIDCYNVIRSQGSIDESLVNTDDGSRGGHSRSRRHRHLCIPNPRSRLCSLTIVNDKSEDPPLVA